MGKAHVDESEEFGLRLRFGLDLDWMRGIMEQQANGN